jgi:hypothetical protein
MRRIMIGALALMAWAAVLRAADDPAKKPSGEQPASLKERYQALEKEMAKAQQQIIQDYSKAKTDEERDQIIDRFRKLPQSFAARFLKLGEEKPGDPAAFDALAWAAQNGTGPEAEQAVRLLLKEHADKVATLAPRLVRAPSPAAGKLLEAALEKAATPQEKARAALTLGSFFKNQSELAYEEGRPDAEEVTRQAKEYFEQAAKDSKSDDLTNQAKEQLKELQTLWFGQTAPDIAGEDVAGKKFKLSDYRGKVVLLDFWGNW